MIDYKRDGHIHSPHCPHGSSDTFDMYVKEALRKGLHEISFTEHLPFPCYFMDDKKLLDDSSPSKDEMKLYFSDLKRIKEKYKEKIKINSGCEVDFLDGLEDKSKEVINEFGNYIEDGLISVHFIRINDKFYDIDGLEGFKNATKALGSVEKVYNKYYETIIKAVKSDLGQYKPKRIAHPNLIRVFNKLYNISYNNRKLLENVVFEIKNNGYEVDVNTSGLRKEYCREIFVDGIMKELVKKYEVKQVFGSDSHKAKDVGSNFNLYK
ncbi:histidinol-phosphatase HisJ [Clostridium sp. BJN0001]|uniref:histidinol-phosphatase HisJ n=1 Tax=Clostridium sp. BJN0001 TaxID=2930219 RepID=UPI001FD2499A|nr:histidinol-phosphatase HisJ [Clostridium sp. BJN0001]